MESHHREQGKISNFLIRFPSQDRPGQNFNADHTPSNQSKSAAPTDSMKIFE
jgi:hypothetical protein